MFSVVIFVELVILLLFCCRLVVFVRLCRKKKVECWLFWVCLFVV